MLIRRCFLILAVFIFAASTEPSADPLHVGPNGSELGLQKNNVGGGARPTYCAGQITRVDSDRSHHYDCINTNGLVWVSVDIIKSYADRLSASEAKINEMEKHKDEQIKMLMDNIKTLSNNNDALTKRLDDLANK